MLSCVLEAHFFIFPHEGSLFAYEEPWPNKLFKMLCVANENVVASPYFELLCSTWSPSSDVEK